MRRFTATLSIIETQIKIKNNHFTIIGKALVTNKKKHLMPMRRKRRDSCILPELQRNTEIIEKV